jgi:predicted RNase H-like HicB family nuclease
MKFFTVTIVTSVAAPEWPSVRTELVSSYDEAKKAAKEALKNFKGMLREDYRELDLSLHSSKIGDENVFLEERTADNEDGDYLIVKIRTHEAN